MGKPHVSEAEQPKKDRKKIKGEKTKPFLTRKISKQILKEKRAKLIVKNLPFKVTEETIKEHFGEYGDISKVDILKRPDGKLMGCAFIQYSLVQFARKAKYHTDNQPFMGRNIQVDFAKPKGTYLKEKDTIKVENEVKKEVEDTVIKESDTEDDRLLSDELNDENNVCDDNSEDNASQISQDRDNKKRFQSHDVSEGKTVFIKNVPFQATNQELKDCMLQFGPVYYALICVDKLTEHSKGTAFVKFVNKDDAEKALSAGTELTLLGNILDCHSAIDRDELRNKEKAQKDQKGKPKDSRNLYLVKEGVILAGTKAAEGVSASDMAKRLQIEQYKTQMLRNLNTFVSRDRLVVHNLPATWDDRKLKILFQKHGGPGALVREARIMRNMRKLDSKGIGESKQFGFVAFTTHEHALTALRALNNNPNVFSPQKRPIITFSIESKAALKAKIKRQEKSRLKNPKAKDFDSSLVKKDAPMEVDEETKSYAGITAKEGTVQKLRSRYKLSQQAKLHHETIKKEKRMQKLTKKSFNERKKDFTKQPKQKINKKQPEDNFSKMVNDYKKKLVSGLDVAKKSKWYND